MADIPKAIDELVTFAREAREEAYAHGRKSREAELAALRRAVDAAERSERDMFGRTDKETLELIRAALTNAHLSTGANPPVGTRK